MEDKHLRLYEVLHNFNHKEKSGIIDILKKPVFYLKSKQILNKAKSKINTIDNNFNIPRNLKIRFTSRTNTRGILNLENNRWILRINPELNANSEDMLRTIVHELVHYWLGPDINSGSEIFPQHILGIDDDFGIYKNINLPLRFKLYCFLYQQNRFKRKFSNMTKLNGYYDIFFEGYANPYIHFEENLVNYTTMKIMDDNIEMYPQIEYIFKNEKDEKEIFEFIEDKMPHLRNAVEKLIYEF